MTEEQQRLAAIRGDETRWWLCEGRGDEAHATLVLGWSAMVRRLAAECINSDAPPEAVQEAETWLTKNADDWCFDFGGTANWHVDFEDGGWAVTLVTDASGVIAAPEAAPIAKDDPSVIPHTGPINVGDEFMWLPGIPRARAKVRVTRVQDVPDHDRRIHTIVVVGGVVNLVGEEAWNDESRFREACVLVPRRADSTPRGIAP